METARNTRDAGGAPSDDDTETWGSTTDDDIETWAETPDLASPLACGDVPAALCETENQMMVQRERDEVLLAEAGVALARSQLESEETAAAALREKLELQSAKQQVTAAELALEAAQENNSALMEKAKNDVLLAKAVAENKEREGLMAGAIAAVEAAELRAEQAADDLVKKREQELSVAKMQGDTAATERALHALKDGQAAVTKERSDAQAAAIVALDTTKQTEEELQAAESKMEEIELRAAVNAELSTKAEKHVGWFSTGAAVLLVSTVFLISFGTSSIIYMLANRVIDNDKLMVTSAQQEYIPLDSC